MGEVPGPAVGDARSAASAAIPPGAVPAPAVVPAAGSVAGPVPATTADCAAAPADPAAGAAVSAPHPGAVPAPGEPRREDADWFRHLPPALQDEYRALWAAEAARRTERVENRKRSYLRCAASGALVFGITHLMFGFGGFAGMATALACGAALGAAWEHRDAGPMVCAVSAVVLYTPVWLAAGAARGAGPFVAPVWGLAALIVMSLGGVAGTLRELRRDDAA